jgi:hypothetical protein
MTEDSHFERFVFAYLELVEQIGAEKAGQALLVVALASGVVKHPRGKGRPPADLFPEAAIYAHAPLKKQFAMGDKARMLRRAYRQRVEEHDRLIKLMMREFGLTEEEAEEKLQRGIILTLALEASGQKYPQ